MASKIFSLGAIGAMVGFLAACQPVPTSSEQQVAPSDASAVVADTTPSSGVAFANPIVSSDFLGGQSGNETVNILLRYKAIEQDGIVYICGAVSARGSREATRFATLILQRSRLVENGNLVLGNLRFFRMVSRSNFETRLVGVETRCQPTDIAAGTIDLNAIRVEGGEGSYRVPRRR